MFEHTIPSNAVEVVNPPSIVAWMVNLFDPRKSDMNLEHNEGTSGQTHAPEAFKEGETKRKPLILATSCTDVDQME
jgi:hypothetical protein